MVHVYGVGRGLSLISFNPKQEAQARCCGLLSIFFIFEVIVHEGNVNCPKRLQCVVGRCAAVSSDCFNQGKRGPMGCGTAFFI